MDLISAPNLRFAAKIFIFLRVFSNSYIILLPPEP